MKVTIRYADEDKIDVDIDDIAERAWRLPAGECNAQTIAALIKSDVDEFVTEQPWPSYRVCTYSLDKLVEAVRERIEDMKVKS